MLSMDPAVGDFEEADVLIEGNKIAAVGPNLHAAAKVVDAKGMIVIPGLITTHHHQYETIQRSIIPDGLLGNFGGGPNWPEENYVSVVQQIWTSGLIPGPNPGDPPIWDLGRSPYDPEDCYIAELVACLSEVTQGITCGVDTSQSSHTPAHTDAMIQGLMDSGRRSVYAYSGGTNRSGSSQPNAGYEYPGIMGDETLGIGRLRREWFNSSDQLVTLGFGGGPTPAFPGAPYTGWDLARSVGASMHNHNVGSPQTIINAYNAGQGPFDDVEMIHCVRWQDTPVAQISIDAVTSKSTAWEIFANNGGHASIAVLIEQQMRHGMPPLQMALDHGILPSLSPDVETNMTTDPFSLMRGAFCLQRGLANDLAFPISNPSNLPVPQDVTARQCLEMLTIAGAANCQLSSKVGTLTPGKEADIVMLDAHNINIAPMNNIPGTIVTMMNPTHVRNVMIAGRFVYWHHKLVGWDVDKLIRDVTASRNRVLARIQGPALSGAIPPGNNSFSNPYRPNFLGSCCYSGQNTTAPDYVLRP